jgi:hypothetical protein
VPITVTRDRTRRWIVARLTGTISLAEMLTFIKTERATVDYQMWPLLLDARSATTDATEEDVAQIVGAVREAVARHGTRGHVAIVADDDVFYARMLLYEMECGAIGVRIIRVFRQLKDAECWLAIVSVTQNFG